MRIKLSEGAIKPTRATTGSAGYDLYAKEGCTVGGGRPVQKVPTGLYCEIPEGYAGLIYARSGLATKFGVRPANCVAVIDSDYRGEILVPLRVDGPGFYEIKAGERIAQMVLTPVLTPELEVVEELSETARGEGGFGSTGKN